MTARCHLGKGSQFLAEALLRRGQLLAGKCGLPFLPSLLIWETHRVEGHVPFPPGLQAVQTNHGVGRGTVRAAIRAGRGTSGLLDATEAAQVNYRHILLLWEGELAMGSTPDDLQG